MADEPTPTPDAPKPEAEPKTLTQEQINQIVETRLAREREKQESERDAERKKLEDEKKSEIQKLADRVAEAEKKNQDLSDALTKSEMKALRSDIGNAAKLPQEFHQLLQGDDEDALKAHAQIIKDAMGGKDEKPEPKGLGRPKEALIAGASNEDDESEVSAADAEKIADRIASINKL
jgi:hypothetical protein